MLTLKVNDSGDGIHFIFTDFFTKKEKYVDEFDLEQCSLIAKDLLDMIEMIDQTKADLH